MKNSRWKDIYDHLKSKGIDVYSPGQHEGECLSRYVVLKVGGVSQLGQFTSTVNSYDLLVYVPKNEYSELEVFVEQVKSIMRELEPMIKPQNIQTESFFDDRINGHMVSIMYSNNRRML